MPGWHGRPWGGGFVASDGTLSAASPNISSVVRTAAGRYTITLQDPIAPGDANVQVTPSMTDAQAAGVSGSIAIFADHANDTTIYINVKLAIAVYSDLAFWFMVHQAPPPGS